MKPLFWSKVPDVVIQQTIWKDSVDRADKLDVVRIEELFCLAHIDSADLLKKDDTLMLKRSANNDHMKPKSLLESKKAQNLGIFLSGFKLSVDVLEMKLSTFDDDGENGLTSEEINALKRFQPTPEEVEMFKSFKGKMN